MQVVLDNQEKQTTLNNIQTLIGNYYTFFSDLLHRMK